MLKVIIAALIFVILLMWGLEHIWLAFDKVRARGSWHALMTVGILYVIADFVFLFKCILPLM